MKDLNGNEVGVSEDYQDNTALCGFQPAVITVPNTPQNCPLTPNTATNPGWHVSTRDWPARPWIVYTRQGESAAERFNNDGSYADPTSGNWDTFTNEIILVRVDANQDSSKVYRLTLTHTRNVNSGDAWADATASISWDGKYVVFDSNAAWNATGCGAIASGTPRPMLRSPRRARRVDSPAAIMVITHDSRIPGTWMQEEHRGYTNQ
jgi:hypothetical protein